MCKKINIGKTGIAFLSILTVSCLSALPVLADETETVTWPEETLETEELTTEALEDITDASSEDTEKTETDKLDSMKSSLSSLKLNFGSDENSQAMQTILSAIVGDSSDDSLSSDTSVLSGAAKLSESIAQSKGIDTNLELFNSWLDMGALDTGSLDFGIINSEYALAYSTFADSANKTLNDAVSGESLNAVDVFNSSYGDIASSITMKDYSIPDSFNTDSMLSSISSAITSQYNTKTSDGMFSQVKGMISIGSCFEAASQDISSKASLKSSGELSSLLAQYKGTDSNKTAYEQKKDGLNPYELQDQAYEDTKEQISKDLSQNQNKTNILEGLSQLQSGGNTDTSASSITKVPSPNINLNTAMESLGN